MHILIKMLKKIVWGLFFVLSANLYADFDSLNVSFVGSWPFTGGDGNPVFDTLRNLTFWPCGRGVEVLDISDPENIIRISDKIRTRNGYIGDISFFYADNKLYFGNMEKGNYLEIWDVSDIENPYRLCEYEHTKGISNIYTKDTLLYASVSSGLHIFDISDPSSPQFVSEWLSPSYRAPVMTMYIKDTLAFLSRWWFGAPDTATGLEVVNISDVLAPTELSFWDSLEVVGIRLVDDNYAYVVSAEGFAIIDISDPTSPWLVSIIPLPGGKGHAIHGIVENEYVYLLGPRGNTLYIWDIKDVFNPTKVGEYASPIRILTYSVENSYVYIRGNDHRYHVINALVPSSPYEVCSYPFGIVVGGARDVWVKDTLAYVLDPNKLAVFDVSDPSSPKPISEAYLINGGGLEELYIKDNYAYIAARDSGLYIVDISDVFNINLAGRYRNCLAGKIHCENGYAYVLDDVYDSLLIIDVSDPFNPSRAGVYGPPYPTSTLRDIWVKDTIAYIADYVSVSNGKLEIVSVADPSFPYMIGEYGGQETKYIEEIWVEDNYAYITNGPCGLGIVDVSDLTSPVGASYFPHKSGDPIHVENGYAYYLYGALYVVDVHNPFSPTKAGFYYPADTWLNFYVKDGYIYLPHYRGLDIYKFYGAGVEEHKSQVISHKLQVYPNPFVRRTVISYELPVRSEVSIKLYDVAGRCVKTLIDGEKGIGYYKVKWDGEGLSTGIYFAKFTAGDYKSTKKLILMR